MGDNINGRLLLWGILWGLTTAFGMGYVEGAHLSSWGSALVVVVIAPIGVILFFELLFAFYRRGRWGDG